MRSKILAVSGFIVRPPLLSRGVRVLVQMQRLCSFFQGDALGSFDACPDTSIQVLQSDKFPCYQSGGSGNG